MNQISLSKNLETKENEIKILNNDILKIEKNSKE